ncbi:MAG: hypothetical protein QME77_13765 [bacterium]|nr:hypothetical protein [bacterium]
MTIREQLHRLVDELPESRAGAAEKLLRALKAGASIDPVDLALTIAPEDDEPETPEEAAAVQEARGESETIPHDEVLRRLGR